MVFYFVQQVRWMFCNFYVPGICISWQHRCVALLYSWAICGNAKTWNVTLTRLIIIDYKLKLLLLFIVII